MTDLQQAIAAVLSAFAGLKAGDRITPEGHEACWVLFYRTRGLGTYTACVSSKYDYEDRPDCHTISPELDKAIKELAKARK